MGGLSAAHDFSMKRDVSTGSLRTESKTLTSPPMTRSRYLSNDMKKAAEVTDAPELTSSGGLREKLERHKRKLSDSSNHSLGRQFSKSGAVQITSDSLGQHPLVPKSDTVKGAFGSFDGSNHSSDDLQGGERDESRGILQLKGLPPQEAMLGHKHYRATSKEDTDAGGEQLSGGLGGQSEVADAARKEQLP